MCLYLTELHGTGFNKYEVLIDAYMRRERERHKGNLRHA